MGDFSPSHRFSLARPARLGSRPNHSADPLHPYTALIAIHWWGAEGGFQSLADVGKLFQSDWLLLAGWVHYLAYDLFIGTWIARDAESRRIPRWALIPVLPLAFLFGPAGLLLWIMLRTALQPAFRDQTR